MRGKTHALMGTTAASAIICTPAITNLCNASDAQTLYLTGATFILASAWGSLVPDVDLDNSTFSRWHPLISMIIRKILIVLNKGDDHIHRKFTHQIFLPLLIAVFGILNLEHEFAMVPAALFGIALGYTLHILTDWLFSDVWLFAPVIRKGVSVFKLTGQRETLALIDNVLCIIFKILTPISVVAAMLILDWRIS